MNWFKSVFVLFFFMLLTSIAFAKQEYNPMSNRWETVPDNSNWSNQYNSMDNTWSYQPEGAQTEYNSMNNSWDWNSGHNPDNGGDE